MSEPELDKLICPCCQELVVWVDDHRTPHFDRATETFSCTPHEEVLDPLTGYKVRCSNCLMPAIHKDAHHDEDGAFLCEVKEPTGGA